MAPNEPHFQRTRPHDYSPSSSRRGHGFDGFTNLVTDIEIVLARMSSLHRQPTPVRPEPAPAQLPPKAGSRVNWKLVLPIGFAVVLALGFYANNNSSDSSYDVSANSYSAPTAQPSIGVEPALSDGNTLAPPSNLIGSDQSEGDTTEATEAKPDQGSDQLLNRAQLQYCLAEAVRIEGAQKALAPSIANQVAAYNAYVDDFNARCGSYRYYESDMDAAKAYVEAHRAAIDAEGVSRLPQGQVNEY